MIIGFDCTLRLMLLFGSNLFGVVYHYLLLTCVSSCVKKPSYRTPDRSEWESFMVPFKCFFIPTIVTCVVI